MYKTEVIKGYTCYGDEDIERVCNIETKGRYYKGGYSYHFFCGKCKNGSWADESYCNNQIFIKKLSPKKVEHIYCANYDRKDYV